MNKTPLYDLHLALGAKMVPFANYEMPVQYPLGIMKEHQHTRAAAGLFDVSHMGQIIIRGEGTAQALEKIIPVDLAALPLLKQVYGVFTNDKGGMLDDLIICRWGDDEFFLVVNAACKEQDLAYLKQHLSGLEVIELSDRALIALQGPQALAVMQQVTEDAGQLRFMSGTHTTIDDESCFITRSGYTGEDGFELSFSAAAAEKITTTLLSFEQVEAIGLGARDSLRLEAGLCLYGHDMNTCLLYTSPSPRDS